MKNFRKLLGACLALFALMGAQSCNREVAEPSNVEGKAKAEEAIYKEGNEEMPISENLTFDVSEEEKTLKALDATVSATTGTNNRHGVIYDQRIPVVCIVRSNQNDPITYVDNVEIVKQPNGTYKFAKDRIRLAQGSSLASGKKWYLMVVTQNAFNKNNGELSVNATGANLSSSATRVMDIPSASPWIELPMFPNGQPKWSKDWDAARKAKRLKLYPQGVLCRATLRLDDAYKAKLGGDNVNLKITQLKVVSTVLSFSGKFKFDKASLPDLTETSGRPTIAWEPTQTASTAREYRALDADTPEYQKVFNAPNGGSVLQVSGNSSLATIFADSNNPSRVDKTSLPQGVQSIIFWAVPVKGVTNRHTTLIAERGESTLPNKVLAPSHTYIYGKKHTKDAAQGSAVYFDAVYYNPYTPLDYMAEHNMMRQWPNQFRPGGWIPQGPSNVFDTSHGVNSYTFLPWWDVEKTSINSGGRHYTNPNRLQWNSIIPFYGKAVINMVGGSNVDNDNVSVQVGTIEGNTTFSSRIDAQKKVRYALALTGLAGGQKYRTAYRYAMVYGEQREVTTPYLELQKEVITRNVQRRTPPYIKDRNTFESKAIGTATFQWLVMRIEAVQLGAGFAGSVDDIANEDFWNNTPNQRKETRLLPSNYTAYRAYLFPSSIDPSVGRQVKEDFYRGYNVAWGASYEARPNEPTAFYLGDDYLAIFDAPNGRWGIKSMRDDPRYVGIRFPVRPFTKQER